MLLQWIAAAVLVLASAAYLLRRWIRNRREGAVCDRCAAVTHLRMAKRPDSAAAGAGDPKKP